MVIPQPSLSEKVINRAASPTHSFESFGIISTDSFSFHSLGVGSLAQSPATLNPSKEPTNPDTDCHRSEEHTSELQSPMRTSYAVFCSKKKKHMEPNKKKQRRTYKSHNRQYINKYLQCTYTTA